MAEVIQDQGLGEASLDVLAYDPVLYSSPEHHEATQRSLLLLELLRDLLPHGLPEGLALLARDVSVTVQENVLSLKVRQAARDLMDELPQASSLVPPLPLTPWDLRAATARLGAFAAQCGVPLPGALAAGEDLHVPPDAGALLPRELPLDCLYPPLDVSPYRSWLAEAAGEAEQGAVLCVWWVAARAVGENLKVGALLELGGRLLSVAEDERREAGVDRTRCRELRGAFENMRRELENLPVPSLQRPCVIPRGARESLLGVARTALLDCSQAVQGYITVDQRTIDSVLWSLFDHLDMVVERGEAGADDPGLRLLVTFNALHALAHSPRAPGMRLPLTVEVAAQLSGVDPFWEWKRSQGSAGNAQALAEAFLLVGQTLYLAHLLESPEYGATCQRLMGQAAGHLFAVCRRLGIQLPCGQQLRELFGADDPQWGRASALTVEQLVALERQSAALMRLTITRPEAGAGAEVLDVPQVEDEPEVVPSLWPAHVLDARALLAGRGLTLLGGVPCPAHKAALEAALGVEVDWIGADEYQHGLHAASRVRTETGVVVLAVRWMGHAHNGLRDVAREKGVPCVMHPGGLSPSSIAYQIVQQVGRQLGAA